MIGTINQNIPSTVHIVQPQIPVQQTYSTISCRDYVFRVLDKQYYQNMTYTLYSCLLWTMNAMATSILILTSVLNLNILPYLVALLLAYIPLNIYVIVKRQYFSRLFIISSFGFHLAMMITAVLIAIKQQYTGFVWLSFGLIQLTCSCQLIQSKGNLFLKALVFIQLTLVGFKMDNNLALDWKLIFVGLLLMVFCLLSFSLIFLIYICVSRCQQQRYFQIKKIGLLYIVFNLINAVLLFTILLWRFFINQNYVVITATSICVQVLTTIFIFIERTQITIYLCEHVEPAQKSDLNIKIELCSSVDVNSIYKISENWYVKDYNSQTCEQDLLPAQCLVCMSVDANIVWMPCGHCTLCEKCCMNLLATKITNCPLCKDKPDTILKISKEDNPMNEQTLKSLRKNQYLVLESYIIKTHM